MLLDVLMDERDLIEALIAPTLGSACGKLLDGIKHLQSDHEVFQYSAEDIVLVNAIGSVPNQLSLRMDVYEEFINSGYRFRKVIAKSAIVSNQAILDEGVQVLNGAIVNDCIIGANTIINTGAIVEHSVSIGRHSHVAPGATICGGVEIGDKVHIGAGATVIQGVTIADKSIVGAGSVVTQNLSTGDIHYPAKSFIKKGGL